MTTDEASAALGMSIVRFRIAVRDGLLPLTEPEDTRQWDRDAVIALARQRKGAEGGWALRCARVTAGSAGR